MRILRENVRVRCGPETAPKTQAQHRETAGGQKHIAEPLRLRNFPIGAMKGYHEIFQ